VPGTDGPDQCFSILDTKGKSYKHGPPFGRRAIGDISFFRLGVMDIRYDKQATLLEKILDFLRAKAMFTALVLVGRIPIKS